MSDSQLSQHCCMHCEGIGRCATANAYGKRVVELSFSSDSTCSGFNLSCLTAKWYAAGLGFQALAWVMSIISSTYFSRCARSSRPCVMAMLPFVMVEICNKSQYESTLHAWHVQMHWCAMCMQSLLPPFLPFTQFSCIWTYMFKSVPLLWAGYLDALGMHSLEGRTNVVPTLCIFKA